MLVEPPGPLLPPRAGLTISARHRLQTAAAAAAVVLAVTSRGDALGLAVLLAVVAWRPVAAAAAGAALVAASWRWGSTSLEAIAGAQAVLGPAGLVGPHRAAVASWLAAGAVVLASPAGRFGRVGSALPALASGTAAAVVVAGPAPGGDVWIRVVAAVLATALAAGAGWCRTRADRVPIVLDAVAVAAALGALALVSSTAPDWWGTVDGTAVAAGAATALAVALITVVAADAALAMRRAER